MKKIGILIITMAVLAIFGACERPEHIEPEQPSGSDTTEVEEP